MHGSSTNAKVRKFTIIGPRYLTFDAVLLNGPLNS